MAVLLLSNYSSYFSVALMKHTGHHGEEKVSLAYTLQSIAEGCQGRTMEAGTKAEIVRECCLMPLPGLFAMAYSSSVFCFLFPHIFFLYNPELHVLWWHCL